MICHPIKWRSFLHITDSVNDFRRMDGRNGVTRLDTWSTISRIFYNNDSSKVLFQLGSMFVISP